MSAASSASPLARTLAPPVPELLSQPRPGAAGGFEQGQPTTPPAPGSQNSIPGLAPTVNCTHTISKACVAVTPLET